PRDERSGPETAHQGPRPGGRIDPREALRLWLSGGPLPSPETGDSAGALAETARLQGVAGLLHTAIERGGARSGWPEAVRGPLHAAFQHGLRLSLVQFLDFRRLLDATPPDAARLLELAAVGRGEAPLAVAVAAAEAVVGAVATAGLRDRLRPHVPRGLSVWLA